jgi:hypothetical protein
VAIAGLATAFFLPTEPGAHSEKVIHGLHHAFVLLGLLTMASTLVFSALKRGDGEDMNRSRVPHSGE